MVCELGGIHDDFSVKDELRGSCFLSFFLFIMHNFLILYSKLIKTLVHFWFKKPLFLCPKSQRQSKYLYKNSSPEK